MTLALNATAYEVRRRGERTALLEALVEYADDPLGFALDWFPWGVEGTDLAARRLEDWQADYLREIGRQLRAGKLSRDKAVSLVIRWAIASGHGIGKSALVSIVILWAFSTMADTKGVVTANTENQLRTKTWAELKKWFRLFQWRFKGHRLFSFQASAIYSLDPDHRETWRIDKIPWSEHNTEAFAGLHNVGKRILVIFDEASAIPDLIHETTEGALTDLGTEIFWLMFGNPTRNTGRFHSAFTRLRHRWHHKQIDSRKVTLTNKRQIDEWIADYGEDSDFVRVRVKGQFPRASSMQFIASDVVAAARKRVPISAITDAMVLGVDVARGGDDTTVIQPRKGRDARTWPRVKLKTRDTMVIVAKVYALYLELGVDMVFVDATGMGGPVADRLRQMGVPCMDIDFGAGPTGAWTSIGASEKVKVANRRAEIWLAMRDWLPGGAIVDDDDLGTELESVEYGYRVKDNAVLLEAKDNLKERIGVSPDNADALACTFGMPIEPKQRAGGPHRPHKAGVEIARGTDADPYE